MASRVRVIIAKELRSAAALGTVGGDEGGGVDLEMPCRIGGQIGGGPRLEHAAGLAEQQSAAFQRRSPRRFFEQCCNRATCHFDGHAHLIAHDPGGKHH